MTVTLKAIIKIVESAETMADMETLENDIPLTEQEVDSLDMANILLLIEEKYDIKIPDSDMNQIQSLDAIVSYLNSK